MVAVHIGYSRVRCRRDVMQQVLPRLPSILDQFGNFFTYLVLDSLYSHLIAVTLAQ